MSVSFSQRVTVPKDVLFRELDGESVLLNLANECYYGLDQVGTRMWQRLTTADCIESAVNLLLKEYDVEPDMLRQDVQILVAQLAENGLIEVDDALA
jgi:hypothetical protein